VAVDLARRCVDQGVDQLARVAMTMTAGEKLELALIAIRQLWDFIQDGGFDATYEVGDKDLDYEQWVRLMTFRSLSDEYPWLLKEALEMKETLCH
jgi:hypothetical protein